MKTPETMLRPRHPIIRGLQYIYLLVAWVFVLGIATQVYFAGLFIFASSSWLEAHSALGWTLITSSLLLPILAVLARFTRSVILLDVLLIVLGILQESLVTFLVGLKLPSLEALHPLNALVIFLVAIIVAYRATRWVIADTKLRARSCPPERLAQADVIAR